MKLRRESAGNGDFSGPKGEFKNRFLGLQSYRDTFRSENRFLNRKNTVIGDRSSRLHEISGLVVCDNAQKYHGFKKKWFRTLSLPPSLATRS
jgi:hypothetical protein